MGGFTTYSRKNIFSILTLKGTSSANIMPWEQKVLNDIEREINACSFGTTFEFSWSKERKSGMGKHVALVLLIGGYPRWTFDYGSDSLLSYSPSSVDSTFYVRRWDDEKQMCMPPLLSTDSSWMAMKFVEKCYNIGKRKQGNEQYHLTTNNCRHYTYEALTKMLKLADKIIKECQRKNNEIIKQRIQKRTRNSLRISFRGHALERKHLSEVAKTFLDIDEDNIAEFRSALKHQVDSAIILSLEEILGQF